MLSAEAPGVPAASAARSDYSAVQTIVLWTVTGPRVPEDVAALDGGIIDAFCTFPRVDVPAAAPLRNGQKAAFC